MGPPHMMSNWGGVFLGFQAGQCLTCGHTHVVHGNTKFFLEFFFHALASFFLRYAEQVEFFAFLFFLAGGQNQSQHQNAE